jgi:hypothetical protein
MYSTYDYGTTSQAEATGVLALFAGLGIVMWIICLAVMVVAIIGMWKLFTKAGKEGWKSIIPIYNVYTLCEIIGVSPWWILISFVCGIIPILGWIVLPVVAVYFGILVAKSTANAFGKDTGFAVGLYFLAPIFYCILGFGKAKYEGAKPMNDIIFKKK